jgi:hypothetical protein
MVGARFQVATRYRNGLDEVRKKEVKRLKEALPAETYKEFKGVMWRLRKTPGELEPEEHGALQKLFNYTPPLGTASGLCYTLTGIFEHPLTNEEGRCQ